MDLIQSLQWRYATKKMDPTKAVSQDKVDRILEAVRLVPTSSGLQPYEVLVVTNREVREKIKAIAQEQGQVLDCSHLLVFAAWNDYTPEPVSYTHLRAHETVLDLVCRLLLEKKKQKNKKNKLLNK